MVLEKIKTLEKINKVEIKDKESEDVYGYEIEPLPGEDLREALSTIVMQAGFSILEFNRKAVSLEDVFRELTK